MKRRWTTHRHLRRNDPIEDHEIFLTEDGELCVLQKLHDGSWRWYFPESGKCEDLELSEWELKHINVQEVLAPDYPELYGLERREFLETSKKLVEDPHPALEWLWERHLSGDVENHVPLEPLPVSSGPKARLRGYREWGIAGLLVFSLAVDNPWLALVAGLGAFYLLEVTK